LEGLKRKVDIFIRTKNIFNPSLKKLNNSISNTFIACIFINTRNLLYKISNANSVGNYCLREAAAKPNGCSNDLISPKHCRRLKECNNDPCEEI